MKYSAPGTAALVLDGPHGQRIDRSTPTLVRLAHDGLAFPLMDAIGIIGVGRLAGFLVEGLRRGGCDAPILLSPRNAQRAAELAEQVRLPGHGRQSGCRRRRAAGGHGRAAARRAGDDPRPALARGAALVCVAIDVDLACLRPAAPGVTIVRAMPSAACAIGLGATPICPPDEAVQRLLEQVGLVFPLRDEAAFNAATALAGYHLWLFALMGEVAAEAEAEGHAAGGLRCGWWPSSPARPGALALAADPSCRYGHRSTSMAAARTP